MKSMIYILAHARIFFATPNIILVLGILGVMQFIDFIDFIDGRR